MMKSSTKWPTSLSTSAVATAVRYPKHFRRPLDVLYSPPPSQALNSLAVRMRVSPGSRRSMTSPSEIWSKTASLAGLMVRLMVKCGSGLRGGLDEFARPRRDLRPVARLQRSGSDERASGGRGERAGPQELAHGLGRDAACRHELDLWKRALQRLDVGGA